MNESNEDSDQEDELNSELCKEESNEEKPPTNKVKIEMFDEADPTIGSDERGPGDGTELELNLEMTVGGGDERWR